MLAKGLNSWFYHWPKRARAAGKEKQMWKHIKSPHFHLHILEFLEVALCFGLHVPQIFFHGSTLFSYHRLHPVGLLFLHLKLLKHGMKHLVKINENILSS